MFVFLFYCEAKIFMQKCLIKCLLVFKASLLFDLLHFLNIKKKNNSTTRHLVG